MGERGNCGTESMKGGEEMIAKWADGAGKLRSGPMRKEGSDCGMDGRRNCGVGR